MTSITYIGSTLAVAVGKPATEDATTYKALAWSDIGKIISIGLVTLHVHGRGVPPARGHVSIEDLNRVNIIH